MEVGAAADAPTDKALRAEGWVRLVDENGATYYLHEASGHSQTHFPTVAVTPLPRSRSFIKSQSRRSISSQERMQKEMNMTLSAREKAYQVQILKNQSKTMASDYMTEVDKYNLAKPYARLPDNSYPEAMCFYCHVNPCHKVLFPCQHKCVCDPCIRSHHVGESLDDAFTGCPVCLNDVKIMFEHTGNEINEYWDWVYEVKPRFSWMFEHKFKQAATKLGKKAAPGVVHPTNGTMRRMTMAFRAPTMNHADTDMRHNDTSSPHDTLHRHRVSCSLM